MGHPVIFPQPKVMRVLGGEVVLGRRVAVWADAAGTDLVHRGLDVLQEALRRAGAGMTLATEPSRADVRLLVAAPASGAEDYEVSASQRPVVAAASSPRAALHAAHTLRQLLRRSAAGVALPRVEIQDRPDLPNRGVFQEATMASAAMTLDDWTALLDLLSSLKMNTLMAGLYSCWRRADHDKEFLLVPSRRHPRLVSPMRERYYSAPRRRRVEREFVPLMAAQDFFGEVIARGLDRGVRVIPYVSALGHNTLIPRIYPDISMKDASDRPIAYGFCTSNPQTYRVLFDLFDEIIDGYLRPHGLDRFGIGMDEVRHACECGRCRRRRNTGVDNFMMRHLVKVLAHLKRRGIRRVLLWHDMFERGGFLNRQLADLLERRGLADLPAFCWWAYGDLRGAPELCPRRVYHFSSFRPELGLARWSAPSAGWNFSMPWALSRVENVRSVWTHAQIAARDGAEGMVSYSCHDPIFLEGYHALAEYSWNATASNDLRAFHEREARGLCGGDWAEWLDAVERMQQGFAPWEEMFNVMFSRVYRKLTPGAAIMGLKPEMCDPGVFDRSQALLAEAGSRFRDLSRRHPEARDIARMYASDCDWVAGVLAVVQGTLELIRDWRRARSEPDERALAAVFGRTCRDLDRDVRRLLAGMASVERNRCPANAPYLLDRLTQLYDFGRGLQRMAAALRVQLRRGSRGALPLFAHTLDRFYNEAVGVRPFDA